MKLSLDPHNHVLERLDRDVKKLPRLILGPREIRIRRVYTYLSRLNILLRIICILQHVRVLVNEFVVATNCQSYLTNKV